MKAQALPEPIQRAANELEAAATEREKWHTLAQNGGPMIEGAASTNLTRANERLHSARVELAAAINAECARQFEAGIATAGGKAG